MIDVTGGPLQLLGCTLLGTKAGPLVSCKRSDLVEITGCSFEGGSTSIDFQVGPGPQTQLRMERSTIASVDFRSSAITLGSARTGSVSGLRLALVDNTIDTGCLLHVSDFLPDVDVFARDNRVQFSQALLSCTGFSCADAWRQSIRWHAQANHYHGPSDWLQVDGSPAGPRGLQEWREFWPTTEAGSEEESRGRPIETAWRQPR